ncbi:hypothetical protein [Actinocrinis sp.]|uniref:hypothetical protein n=1 Tax=Actinocrinis sp. TaxID=1920516 RepID=UPI002D6E8A46|nr:hypothetical protein [Actinocrinis sp.]HZP54980.1 hypothetical protein [Actinocrinis sp.]
MNDTDTSPTTEPEWADDGHRIRVTLDQGQFEFTVICPFDATDLTGRDWADLPVCRRAGDEGGNPRPDKSPTANCGLAIFGEEFTSDEFFDSGPDVPVFEVVSPFPVVYRFAGWDGDEVYVRPKPAVQSPGQGVLPVETEPETSACPSCDGTGQETDAEGASQGECLRCHGSGTVEAPSIWVTHGGADRPVPYQQVTSLADLFASACDVHGVGESERQRLGLFNGGGVQLDTDRVLRHVAPGDLLVLRPRIVRA